jgi:hypothetical protein
VTYLESDPLLTFWTFLGSIFTPRGVLGLGVSVLASMFKKRSFPCQLIMSYSVKHLGLLDCMLVPCSMQNELEPFPGKHFHPNISPKAV